MSLSTKLQEFARSSPKDVEASIKAAAVLFGFEKLKKQQQKAVEATLCGKDVFVSLPTGFGKSLIYQLLPVCAEELATRKPFGHEFQPFILVVSPLVSLMQDQVASLQGKGFKASLCVTRGNDDTCELDPTTHSFIFASPEALLGVNRWRKVILSDKFRDNVLALVIDEAHCVAKWGMGDIFREWYGRIGQLRSLLPSTTPVLALTATATNNIRKKITGKLQMQTCDFIEESPDRPNIRYSVVCVKNDLQLTFGWLIHSLKTERTSLDRVVVFCRSLHTCASLYKLFAVNLREESYEPIGSAPDVSKRLFAMYHSKIDEVDKTEILKSLRNEHGVCRVLFSTIAFGMGVDISNIRIVIHYGSSTDVDDYVQEAGRAGRDKKLSHAILYKYPYALLGHASKAMKDYVRLDKGCRRDFLLKQFTSEQVTRDGHKHLCCDLCTAQCQCEDPCPYKPPLAETLAVKDGCDTNTGTTQVRQLSDEQRSLLKSRLLELRLSLLAPSLDHMCNIPLYVGEDIACGLSEGIINSIVESCDFIETISDLEEKCLIFGYGQEILNVIDSIV